MKTKKPTQKQNKPGLPKNLKTGLEDLSGNSFDNAKVHYNSPRPSKVKAAAYNQGSEIHLAARQINKLNDGDLCKVVGGTHTGKSGTVRDINTSKTGHITITVEQKNGVKFKTLGKNVVVLTTGME